MEILFPLVAVYLLIRFRFNGKLLLNDTSFLFESLIVFTLIGGILGLYLNDLVFDVIDHYFNIHSIIFGLLSSLFLIFGYKTKYRKLFYLIDLALWITILTVKGGYQFGFGIGLPYPSVLLFDIISSILRLQLFRKLLFDFRTIGLILITILIISIKIIFLGYPLLTKI